MAGEHEVDEFENYFQELGSCDWQEERAELLGARAEGVAHFEELSIGGVFADEWLLVLVMGGGFLGFCDGGVHIKISKK